MRLGALPALCVVALSVVAALAIHGFGKVAQLALEPRPVGSVAPAVSAACGESVGDTGAGSLHCGPGARASYDRDAGLGYCRCTP